MLTGPDEGDVPGRNALLGIGMKIGSVIFFVASGSLIKLAPSVPLGQQFFIRSVGALGALSAVLLLRRELWAAARTRRPLGHLWRGTLGISALLLTMYGLANLPLSEVITISYGAPFVIVMLSAFLLGERVGPVRWSAVVLGAGGIVLIMWPRLTDISANDGNSFLATIAVAFSCIAGAFAMLALKSLGSTESSSTIVLHFFVISVIAGAIMVCVSGWTSVGGGELAALLAAGVAGSSAQLLLAESYKHAEMSTIAPFEYTSIVISLTVGILLFDEKPTRELLIGAAIVAFSGVIVVLREHRSRR